MRPTVGLKRSRCSRGQSFFLERDFLLILRSTNYLEHIHVDRFSFSREMKTTSVVISAWEITYPCVHRYLKKGVRDLKSALENEI